MTSWAALSLAAAMMSLTTAEGLAQKGKKKKKGKKGETEQVDKKKGGKDGLKSVADFTKDINRARVLTLGTLSHNEPSVDGIVLDSTLTLEQAMNDLAASEKEAINVTRDGQMIGQVTMRDMIYAASRVKAGDGDTVTYR